MFDEIMRLATRNAGMQMGTLDSIAVNIANMNTTGYKTKRFEQYLNNDGELGGVNRVDMSPGPLRITRNEFDIGVKGFGYIPVTQPDGTVAYTRDGSLTVNSQGYLITNNGDIVGNGIQLPLDYETLQIHEDGRVLIKRSEKSDFQEIGRLKLVRFANPEKLSSIGYNKLVATAGSGEAVEDPDSILKQGMLESANVNVHEQVEQILRLNASLISNLRIIKFVDDLYRQSSNLRQ